MNEASLSEFEGRGSAVILSMTCLYLMLSRLFFQKKTARFLDDTFIFHLHNTNSHNVKYKRDNMLSYCRRHVYIFAYRVAWSHRMPYLPRSFSAKEPYN